MASHTLHVGGAPAIADWLPNEHPKLRDYSIGESLHGDSRIINIANAAVEKPFRARRRL